MYFDFVASLLNELYLYSLVETAEQQQLHPELNKIGKN